MLRECVLHPYRYYILATTPRTIEDYLVLKSGDTFAVFNRYGDIGREGLGEEGIFHRGTRYLSRLEFLLCDTRPFLLSSAVRSDNLILTADLTNPDVFLERELFLPRGVLHIKRSKILLEQEYLEEITIENFSVQEIHLPFSLMFDADFADIFEVRGTQRKKRGRSLPPIVEEGKVVLRYTGLDGVKRETILAFTPHPMEVGPGHSIFHIHLKPGERSSLFISTEFMEGEQKKGERVAISFKEALSKTRQVLKELKQETCLITTSNEAFNSWLERSHSDIFMMLTHTPYGLYPYAGIPWFSTAFGRDGIITALECLWINPSIARGVLKYLAATQATEVNPEEDAEPGKIIHEIRHGEMAALGEIPFGRYYGSVDATPLFVVLAGEYFLRTGDTHLIQELWPHIELALNWINQYGDRDEDGFVEYSPSPNGLINKGWKDSHDSVMHADGSMAPPPIALVEVQGYVYQAKLLAALMARAMGMEEKAQQWEREAERLAEDFSRAFWDKELGVYVLALDGHKRPCRVKTSNAGHTLFSGIAPREHAKSMTYTLFEKSLFSGWGIRTLASTEVLYNPLSYHNGSVWPHDNAIIAFGLGRYGFKDGLTKLIKGLFEASTHFPLNRLPELFCGFPKRVKEAPTPYPVACNPQSWAAGAVFMLLQASLGLSFKGKQVVLRHPTLPPFLDEVHIRSLRVADTSLDLSLRRSHGDVVVNVLRKRKDIEVVIIK